MDAPETRTETRRGLAESVPPTLLVSKQHAGHCEATPANICTFVTTEALRLALRRQAVGRG
jgi:hypothetical protein